MEIAVTFPGGARVDAHFNSFKVSTDQPVSLGGENSAPSPFELFLASLATCAGVYVQGFCKMRGIPSEAIRLIQKAERDPNTKMVRRVSLDIQLPKSFPQQYVSAVIRAAESCLVKKHLENPPALEVTTSIASME
jgi:ribosomal protein S12 methylthiotransferase accessory factor